MQTIELFIFSAKMSFSVYIDKKVEHTIAALKSVYYSNLKQFSSRKKADSFPEGAFL